MTEIIEVIKRSAETTTFGKETNSAKERLSAMVDKMTNILGEKDDTSQKDKLSKYFEKNINPFLDGKDSSMMEGIIGGVIYLSILKDGDNDQRNAIGMGSVLAIEKILPGELKKFAEIVRGNVVDYESLKQTMDIFYEKNKDSEISLVSYEILYQTIEKLSVHKDKEDQKNMILATITEKMAPGGEAKEEVGVPDEVQDVVQPPIETQETEGGKGDESYEIIVDDFFKGMNEGGKVDAVEDEKPKDTEKKEEIDVFLARINSILECDKIIDQDELLELQREFGLKFLDEIDGTLMEVSRATKMFVFHDENTEKFFLIPSPRHLLPERYTLWYKEEDIYGRWAQLHTKINKIGEATELKLESNGKNVTYVVKKQGIIICK